MSYRISRSSSSNPVIGIVRDESVYLEAESIGEYLYLIEKDMTIELQKQLKHLYFIHAAVLAHGDQAIIITAPSGTGKSTTAWALLHHGCRYLSDELAPIDLTNLTVQGYPRALGLKRVPPVYALPDHCLDTDNSLHVSVDRLPGGYCSSAVPVTAVFILEYAPQLSKAEIEPASKSTAAAHIYANALNALAHENKGLEGAVSLAMRAPCFHLKSTPDLAETCEALLSVLKGIGKN
ncbi:MAG: hypothetical protein WDZ30_04050 [Cellvibrionaceae bacterium]